MGLSLDKLYGIELDRVKGLLSSNGFEVKTKETKPPGKKIGRGVKRVLVSRVIRPEFVEVIWSYENYE